MSLLAMLPRQVGGLPTAPTENQSSSGSTITTPQPSNATTPTAASNTKTSNSSPASTTKPPGAGEESQDAASVSRTALPSANSQGDNDTALHAGLGVLGAALLIALFVIGFLLFRRRRRSPPGHAAPTTYSDTTDPESTAVLGGYGEKKGAGSAGAGGGVLSIVLPAAIDDKTVNGRFARLDAAIQDWVAGTFRNGTPVAPETLSTDITVVLNSISAEWQSLLVGDQRARFVLLRGLVAAILSQAWANGELLGDADTARVSSRISNGTPNPQTSLWRAQTFTLLATSSDCRAARTAAIEQLASRIDNICGTLLVLPPGLTSAALGTRSQRLRTVVANASELALDLGQQRVAYAWHSPVGGNTTGNVNAPSATLASNNAACTGPFDGMFNTKEMEDALQEHAPNRLDGRRVKAIIFPAVARWGSTDGGVGSWERAAIVRRAGVLV